MMTSFSKFLFPSPAASNLSYRADIDGLRAIAILAVLIFHLNGHILPGGFVGVDIFFVISGYLITLKLIGGTNYSPPNIIQFYLERARRILPALLVVLGFFLLFGWFVLLKDEYSHLAKYSAVSSVFLVNIVAMLYQNYFSENTVPYKHLWSLGIEEQYYLLWPLLITFARYVKKPHLTICLFVLLSLCMNFAVRTLYKNANFYLPVTRFWELGLGGLLASILQTKEYDKESKGHSWVATVLSLTGSGLILSSFFLINGGGRYPGFLALLPVSGSILLIGSGRNAIFNRYVLQCRPLVWIGLISYPLYLWHYPLLIFTKTIGLDSLNRYCSIYLVALAFALSWLTYRFVEYPIRSGQYFKKKPIVLVYALASMLLVSLLIGFIPPRLSTPETKPIIEAAPTMVFPAYTKEPALFEGYTLHKFIGGESGEVLYIGDSNMNQYEPRIEAIFSEYRNNIPSAVFLTNSSCRPIPDTYPSLHEECRGLAKAALLYVKTHPVNRIVIAGSWAPGLYSSSINYWQNGKTYPLSTQEGHQGALQAFSTFLKSLKATGVDVQVILNMPSSPLLGRAFLRPYRLSTEPIVIPDSYPRSLVVPGRERKEITDIASNAGVKLIDPVATMCDARSCAFKYDGNHLIYRDDHHLTVKYVKKHASFLDETLLKK